MTTVIFAAGCHDPNNNDYEVRVTTLPPTEITSTTAICGGDAIVIGNGTLVEVGVCWATSVDPTIADQKMAADGCGSPFADTLTDLAPNTTYHVRAYALSSSTYYYGEDKSFTTLVMGVQPTVQTVEVTEITATTAVVGGQIIDDGGTEVTECGVCYRKEQEEETCLAIVPINNVFSTTLSELMPNTTYTVRAYVSNEVGTSYGEEMTFVTFDNHDYVDLGLPSGTLWATCDVGATTPEGYGVFFAWGEVYPKIAYNWNTYQHCNGSENTYTKYCDNPSYGYNGFTDDLTVLQEEDDAATVNWGAGWRMPTIEEMEELYQYTSQHWETRNGVVGRVYTAANGNSIFLSAAGWCDNTHHQYTYDVYRWSSSLQAGSNQAWTIGYYTTSTSLSTNYRYRGFTVRPVRFTH